MSTCLQAAFDKKEIKTLVMVVAVMVRKLQLTTILTPAPNSLRQIFSFWTLSNDIVTPFNEFKVFPCVLVVVRFKYADDDILKLSWFFMIKDHQTFTWVFQFRNDWKDIKLYESIYNLYTTFMASWHAKWIPLLYSN